jgi:hypothetical protein
MYQLHEHLQRNDPQGQLFKQRPYKQAHSELDHDLAAALQASLVMAMVVSSPESAFGGSVSVHQVLEDYQMYQLREQREEPPRDAEVKRLSREHCKKHFW